MFADPQTVTINATPYTLARTGIGDGNATYRTADEALQLRISHKKAKNRIRRMVRLDQTIVAADPLNSENAYQTAGCYIVIDEPAVGFTDAQLDYLAAGLIAYLTQANRLKVLGSET